VGIGLAVMTASRNSRSLCVSCSLGQSWVSAPSEDPAAFALSAHNADRHADHAVVAARQEDPGCGKSVVVDLQLDKVEPFIENPDPRGLLLCIAADEEIQPEIIRRVQRW
jgi:hypothetical protein